MARHSAALAPLSARARARRFAGALAFAAAVPYPVRVEKNVEARMSDGIVLRADVYRPDAPGRFPALVKRTPYSKSAPSEIPLFERLAALPYVDAPVLPYRFSTYGEKMQGFVALAEEWSEGRHRFDALRGLATGIRDKAAALEAKVDASLAEGRAPASVGTATSSTAGTFTRSTRGSPSRGSRSFEVLPTAIPRATTERFLMIRKREHRPCRTARRAQSC